ncbi:MAG: phosphoribosylaminoimidazolesuccinocarboxamide synthase [candidate division WOR-3 bacterium]
MLEALIKTELSDLKLFKRGKVRDIYEIDDALLIIATDRVSTFDVVLQDGIPDRGKVLTQLSCFWFDYFKTQIKSHLISADVNQFPKELQQYRTMLDKRAMLVRRCQPIKIECVARGYLAGSGWVEYQRSGTVSGIKLPKGLTESSRLPEIIFTPTTKAGTGHDMSLTIQEMIDLIGVALTEKLRDLTIKIYEEACRYAETKGIIIADTKFEFGFLNNELVIIDELLTPDSSRFWDKQEYRVGSSPPSYDKQYLRDYLINIGWDKNPPAPKLPPEVITMTRNKYLEAYYRLTGKKLEC